ncbi:hypothetical protein LPH50_09525 [Xylella taiwanensis]|uniref:Uncharacterized protein n=1 Tax=Xylella taiwanensis TaxID=1444770 RepID=Z9JKS2_9GAMM|nr:hypothetical protein [Xylella taiwanensis]EWS78789.1 hypothetical protein AF72_04250 [Xylella taiwanensis]MCD8456179.1 hypothetical protein [Xylella taiwanensis]MCD8458587.1 hypothetical protein [Xylella taiwanensis]MCD8460721.1 hypothetical protein [Xylella taiwanensis]MCD8463219.1 hypothetical protein [Xylella taiwanensis]
MAHTDTDISLEALHTASRDQIAAQFPDLATVAFYLGDEDHRLPLPACLLELTDIEPAPENDAGTGQFPVLLRFQARFVPGHRDPASAPGRRGPGDLALSAPLAWRAYRSLPRDGHLSRRIQCRTGSMCRLDRGMAAAGISRQQRLEQRWIAAKGPMDILCTAYRPSLPGPLYRHGTMRKTLHEHSHQLSHLILTGTVAALDAATACVRVNYSPVGCP